MQVPPIGLDFGTTNSSISCVAADGTVRLASFQTRTELTESFRSLLYLERVESRGKPHTQVSAGPKAIEHYLEAAHKGRLIQSLKSFLSSRILRGTDIFGRQYTVEDLIARIVREVRVQAEQQFGFEIRSACVGRPVRFVGSEKNEDDLYALGRLEKALRLAGLEQISFELEPVGAAYHYESQLDHDELILIGDFGGGTSDFSIIRVGPGVRARGRSGQDLLGNSGVGLAGDAFDAKIVRHLVSPALGAGSEMRSVGKTLPVPTWIYSNLERWHHVSFLKTRDTLNMLKSVEAQAFEPEKIRALLHLINEDLGYKLHRSVQQLKYQLSNADCGRFRFVDADIEIEADVQRTEFERWIENELAEMEWAVHDLLERSNVSPRDVDKVFLTGGTSLVPAVRRIFESRFGAERIETGNEFTSVARGLALRAAQAA